MIKIKKIFSPKQEVQDLKVETKEKSLMQQIDYTNFKPIGLQPKDF